MKIAFTSDLHIDASERTRETARNIANVMESLQPDVIVLAGDAGNTIHALRDALGFFSRIAVPRLFVPGNHDVWIEIHDEELTDSREKYSYDIPLTCEKAGFQDLGQKPVVIGNVGFVGSLGWYDYSFADPRLGLEENDYWKGRFEEEIWWDKEMAFWPRRMGAEGTTGNGVESGKAGERIRDPEICAELTALFDTHIREIEDKVDRIIAVVHTLPFVETLERTDPPYYLDAYTGSSRIGEILKAHPKVTHCIGGHKHLDGDWTIDGIEIHRRVMGRIEEDEDLQQRARNAVGLIEIP